MQEYHVYHVQDKHNASSQKGVSIGIHKATIDVDNIIISSNEGKSDEGMCICITLENMLDKPLSIWGIYAPTNAAEKTQWMNKLGKKIRSDENHTIIAGDFNFVMDIFLEKQGGWDFSGMSVAKI